MSPSFVPGSVDVAPEVLAAQARPILPFRSSEFENFFRATAEKAQPLFGGGGRVFQGSFSGTGMQEAAIRNFVSSAVLICVNGASSERWYDIAIANGKSADRLDADWGQPILPGELTAALTQRQYDAVAIVHNETSTGVENPLPELAAAVRTASPDTLILVDAVSSFGGVRLEMDAWGIDFLFAASQHCLALPPGLSLAAASDRAMQRAEAVPDRGWYFDLVRMERHRLKDSLPSTPAMPLLYALDAQLDRMMAEGFEARYERHAALSARVREWAAGHNLPTLAPEPYTSKTSTVLRNADNWVIPDLNKFLLQRGMRIANGYGRLRETTFRIATMGELQPADVENLLRALDAWAEK